MKYLAQKHQESFLFVFVSSYFLKETKEENSHTHPSKEITAKKYSALYNALHG